MSAATLSKYRIKKLPVSESTSYGYLKSAGIIFGYHTKNYYNDQHESPTIVNIQRPEYAYACLCLCMPRTSAVTLHPPCTHLGCDSAHPMPKVC